MKFLKNAALGSALTFTAMASLVGLGSSTPVTAGSAPASIDSNLLPQAALDAALAEETALPQAIALPSARNRFVAESLPVRGGSLAGMVSNSLSSTTSSREEECLAIGVYYEAKSESLAGQLAVADVILNRTESGRFASSVCGVLAQPGQFSFVRGGRLPSVNRSSRDWQEAVAIARIAQDNRVDSGVGKALFFHATRVSPGWGLTRVTTIGNHIFYR
jgi:spore germination cell wall hydrolase CwlJ-like protein